MPIAQEIPIAPSRAQSIKTFLLQKRIAGLPLAGFVTFVIFVVVGAVAALHHEPNTDEAQGWLIARDLSIPAIFREMHYEGTPPLWHLLLWVLIRLHLPYAALGLVPLTLMSVAVYVWLRWSPLPLPVRLLVPFAFFLSYQYAVVARSYTVSTMLAFVAAALWRHKPMRVVSLGFVLALLAQTNLYGFAMAVGIAAAIAAEYVFQGRGREQKLQWFLFSAALVIASLVLAKYIASPPPDSFDGIRYYVPLHKQIASFIRQNLLAPNPPVLVPFAGSLALPSGPVGAGFLFIVIWFIAARRYFCLLPFLCTLAAMNLVFWAPWHCGLALVAFLVSIWAAWPEERLIEARWLTPLVTAMLTVTMLLQIPKTATAVRNEVAEASSPGKQTAEFLRPLVGKRPVYGPGYATNVVLPYFPTNIFVNHRSSIWTKSIQTVEQDRQLVASGTFPADAIVLIVSEQQAPTVPVVFSDDERLRAHSMRRTHTFCGKMFWFSGVLRVDCLSTYEHE